MTLSRELTGRTAALADLASAVVLGGALIFLALAFIYGGQREEAKENLRQLAIYKSEIDARPEVERAYASLKAQVAAMPGVLHEEGGAPAEAQVESQLKEVVESNGGEVRSAQAMPATPSNGFEIVSIECDLTVPASRLRDLLYAVETHRPYLFIESADITAPVSWDPKSNAEPSYEVRWALRAYRWKGAS
jgi:hypothetical protein